MPGQRRRLRGTKCSSACGSAAAPARTGWPCSPFVPRRSATSSACGSVPPRGALPAPGWSGSASSGRPASRRSRSSSASWSARSSARSSARRRRGPGRRGLRRGGRRWDHQGVRCRGGGLRGWGPCGRCRRASRVVGVGAGGAEGRVLAGSARVGLRSRTGCRGARRCVRRPPDRRARRCRRRCPRRCGRRPPSRRAAGRRATRGTLPSARHAATIASKPVGSGSRVTRPSCPCRC